MIYSPHPPAASRRRLTTVAASVFLLLLLLGPPRLTAQEPEEGPVTAADVVLLIDMSLSAQAKTTQDGLTIADLANAAVRQLVGFSLAYDIDLRLAFANFGGTLASSQPLQEVQDGPLPVPPASATFDFTDFRPALDFAIQQLGPEPQDPPRRRIVLLLTDAELDLTGQGLTLPEKRDIFVGSNPDGTPRSDTLQARVSALTDLDTGVLLIAVGDTPEDETLWLTTLPPDSYRSGRDYQDIAGEIRLLLLQHFRIPVTDHAPAETVTPNPPAEVPATTQPQQPDNARWFLWLPAVVFVVITFLFLVLRRLRAAVAGKPRYWVLRLQLLAHRLLRRPKKTSDHYLTTVYDSLSKEATPASGRSTGSVHQALSQYPTLEQTLIRPLLLALVTAKRYDDFFDLSTALQKDKQRSLASYCARVFNDHILPNYPDGPAAAIAAAAKRGFVVDREQLDNDGAPHSLLDCALASKEWWDSYASKHPRWNQPQIQLHLNRVRNIFKQEAQDQNKSVESHPLYAFYELLGEWTTSKTPTETCGVRTVARQLRELPDDPSKPLVCLLADVIEHLTEDAARISERLGGCVMDLRHLGIGSWKSGFSPLRADLLMVLQHCLDSDNPPKENTIPVFLNTPELPASDHSMTVRFLLLLQQTEYHNLAYLYWRWDEAPARSFYEFPEYRTSREEVCINIASNGSRQRKITFETIENHTMEKIPFQPSYFDIHIVPPAAGTRMSLSAKIDAWGQSVRSPSTGEIALYAANDPTCELIDHARPSVRGAPHTLHQLWSDLSTWTGAGSRTFLLESIGDVRSALAICRNVQKHATIRCINLVGLLDACFPGTFFDCDSLRLLSAPLGAGNSRQLLEALQSIEGRLARDPLRYFAHEDMVNILKTQRAFADEELERQWSSLDGRAKQLLLCLRSMLANGAHRQVGPRDILGGKVPKNGLLSRLLEESRPNPTELGATEFQATVQNLEGQWITQEKGLYVRFFTPLHLAVVTPESTEQLPAL